jgi:hypothetical protein
MPSRLPGSPGFASSYEMKIGIQADQRPSMQNPKKFAAADFM